MRILHTADWHLGKTLEGRDRSEEQYRVMAEICEIAEEEAVDLVLIAGDVYQTVNPPAWAENLFYETIHRLSNFGKRAVVVISGNHDNPERIRAANPLADKQGVYLVGLPKDELTPSKLPRPHSVQAVAARTGLLELAVPTCAHHAVLALLPYPSEARLQELLSASAEVSDIRAAYSERIGQWFAAQEAYFRPDTVNVAMSHLFVHGGQESDSERQIQLGGAYAVEADKLPRTAHYVALGHLHRPQKVAAALAPTRYAGSPLAYSFSEAGQEKSVVLIEAEPGKSATTRLIRLTSGRPLMRWEVTGGLTQLDTWCSEGKDAEAWIDLELHVPHPLSQEDIRRVRKMHRGFVHIRPVFPEGEAETEHVRTPEAKRPEALFRRFYNERTGGEPREAVVDLFLELLHEEADVDGTDSRKEVADEAS
ncbi:exonuclease SbcCD subunit D [Numidum massiliense]|uniref:exonuclease SbcCD subunit D n=1 Tax=Numidum massiliense TaxID=1522315 RepID=UPI0006D593AF|nr:exonuclease SbcCD subunit D [Numidum massiliense]